MKYFYIIQRHVKIYCQENINCVSLKNVKLKWFKIQNFRKIAKFKCCEICAPQNREINVSRKFHVKGSTVVFSFNLNLSPALFFLRKWNMKISSWNVNGIRAWMVSKECASLSWPSRKTTAKKMCLSKILHGFCLNCVFQKSGSSLAYVKREDPDVFCIQETKCQEDTLPKVFITLQFWLLYIFFKK